LPPSPLEPSHQFNTAFFKRFHHSIRDIIAERFKKVYPYHLIYEPFLTQSVLEAARWHFTSNHF
jgi:hypothetical protein